MSGVIAEDHGGDRDAGTALLCPGCGYDLRATAGSACPECGGAFDAEDLRGLWLPWDRERGVVRPWLFLRTVWAVVVGFRRYRGRIGRAAVLRRARWFRFWVGVAALVAVAFWWGLIRGARSWLGRWWGGDLFRVEFGYGGWDVPEGWLVLAAWVGVGWWAWSVSGVQVWAFAWVARGDGGSEVERAVRAERSWAAGLYLSAAVLVPMVLAPVLAVGCGAVVYGVLWGWGAPSVARDDAQVCFVVSGWTGFLLGSAVAWGMQGVAAARATGRGAGYAVMVALVLPVVWGLLGVLIAVPVWLTAYVHAVWWSYTGG